MSGCEEEEDLPGLLQEVCGDGAQDPLHHGQVLLAVVGLKRESSVRHLKDVGHHGEPIRCECALLPPTWKRVVPR